MTAGMRQADAVAALSALPARLRTARFGRPLHVLPSVASTNDAARRLAEDGAGEGTAVVALEQSEGRGRRGRSWASPHGGMYLSVVLRPSLPTSQWPVLSLAAAVGSAEGIETAGGVAVGLKWPNDLLVDGGKVGGILLESEGAVAVAGIGINIRTDAGAAGAPGSLPEGSASIAVPLVSLARAVLERLEPAIDTAYADPAETIRRWKARSTTLGRPVRVSGAEAIEGIAEDVDHDGALIVRTPSGVRRVMAGDVSLG